MATDREFDGDHSAARATRVTRRLLVGAVLACLVFACSHVFLSWQRQAEKQRLADLAADVIERRAPLGAPEAQRVRAYLHEEGGWGDIDFEFYDWQYVSLDPPHDYAWWASRAFLVDDFRERRELLEFQRQDLIAKADSRGDAPRPSFANLEAKWRANIAPHLGDVMDEELRPVVVALRSNQPERARALLWGGGSLLDQSKE
jgi:hypothetical protein